MTAQIPPMPVLNEEAPLWPYINALEAHARDLAARLEASNALCVGLAEALDRFQAEDDDCNCQDGYVCIRCNAIAVFTRYREAAR